MNKKDINFMGSVMSLYNEFEKNGISLVYIGRFTHKITKMFTALTFDESEMNNESKLVRKKLHHSVVEIIQNMIKHSGQLFGKIRFGKGLFILGKKANSYYIITANKVSFKDEIHLTTALDEVNNASPDQLKQMYKTQLKEGTISERGGAGLGLIDICRKSGNRLGYHFIPLNKKQKYFILRVQIDAHSNYKNNILK